MPNMSSLDWIPSSAPDAVRAQVKLSLLDTLGVAIAGRQSKAAQIICDFADANHAGALPMLFDGRRASPAGFALAAGITIDSLDAHDGFNPSKGHIAAPMIPVALARPINRAARAKTSCRPWCWAMSLARAPPSRSTAAPKITTRRAAGARSPARGLGHGLPGCQPNRPATRWELQNTTVRAAR